MIESYFTSTITYKTAGALDKWGKPASYTSATLPCWAEEGSYVVRGANGSDLNSTLRIRMNDKAADYRDRIVYLGREYSIAKIDRPKDFGYTYLMIYLI
jgi:hypothetical protein